MDALADIFASAAGERWTNTQSHTLQRELLFSGFRYLDSVKLIYNWENRFMAVNYNLQIVSVIPTDKTYFEETGDCKFSLECTQKGLRGKRNYIWKNKQWNGGSKKLAAYQKRLGNSLILDRLNALDIMEMEIEHHGGSDCWTISCESIIGSATWLLIPPVLSMITPKKEECVKLMELFELLADAVANNV